MKIKEICLVGLLKNLVVKVFFVFRDYSRIWFWEIYIEWCYGIGIDLEILFIIKIIIFFL